MGEIGRSPRGPQAGRVNLEQLERACRDSRSSSTPRMNRQFYFEDMPINSGFQRHSLESSSGRYIVHHMHTGR